MSHPDADLHATGPASETLRGSVISYKRGEKPSCGQHLAAARWPAVFSSMSMGFDANPRSSTDAAHDVPGS